MTNCCQKLQQQIKNLEEKIQQLNTYGTDGLITDSTSIKSAGFTSEMSTEAKRKLVADVFQNVTKNYAIIFSSSTRIIYVSQNIEEFTDYTAQELLTLDSFSKLLSFIDPDEREQTLQNHLNRVNDENKIDLKTIKLENGDKIKVLSKFFPALDGSLNIISSGNLMLRDILPNITQRPVFNR
jgi:PAS domain-containing protein